MEERSSDAETRQAVWDALSYDIRVDMDQIAAEVDDGTVFLRGMVTSLYDKRVLTEVVSRLKGVLGVVNEVRVIPTKRVPDAEINSEVGAALAGDARLAGESVEVSVQDGIVRLSGEVGSYAQKCYAESDAWATPGVVDILNNLMVRVNGEMAKCD